MDGGIGEAALMGAIIGGGSSAITGGDPLKGALMGGLTSGVMGGFGNLSGVEGFGTSPETISAFDQTANPELLNSQRAATRGLFGLPTEAAPEMSSFTAPQTMAQNYFPGATPAASTVGQPFSFERGIDIVKNNPWTYGGIAASNALPGLMKPPTGGGITQPKYEGPLSKFRYDPSQYTPDVVRPPSPVYTPVYKDYRTFAQGGIAALAPGGRTNFDPSMYPQSQSDKTQYAVPTQLPVGAQAVTPGYEPKTDVYTGQEMPLGLYGGGNPLEELMKSRSKQAKYKAQLGQSGGRTDLSSKAQEGDYDAMLTLNAADKMPNRNFAMGGIAGLNSFAKGKFLQGPGDGMSDSIPATINGRQPARLADGEFVIPADVVSGLGNGSSSAGAKHLYSMMDKVRQGRTGKKKQAPTINAQKVMPA